MLFLCDFMCHFILRSLDRSVLDTILLEGNHLKRLRCIEKAVMCCPNLLRVQSPIPAAVGDGC